ncbi:MAG: succinylglutamate desuccinylase/aspartoacylase family protein [Candidatus Kerfeldbacteria bacterium]|nr:succinylglutamate desuccinylase/aspartoacylase family protein [Candidatus Kerfeldbacteria bacterium]
MKKMLQPIGTIGTIPVDLPILQFGSGTPRVLITAVQHGGELSPLWIIKQLIAQQEKIQGTITIIPVANPFGIIQGTRNEPIEGANLNRAFPGKPTGDFTSRLATVIMNIALKQDFVIDLHTFSRQSPFLVGFAADASGVPTPAVQKIIALLQPDLVWKVNEKKGEDRRFAGSFDGSLTAAGIPSVFIEMPNYQMISPALIDRITQSIITTGNGFLNTTVTLSTMPMLTAQYLYADTAGLFAPTINLLDTVTAGQTIATVTSVTDFTETQIKTPVAGVVMTIKGNDLVRTGSKIASIGI